MNLQSKLIISFILLILVFWLLKNFFNKRLSSGQTLFWLSLLFGAEILTLFPSLVDWMSVIWGNLIPVSWITFAGLVFLIFYLFYQTVQLNKLQSRIIQLARGMAFLEKRLRKAETGDKSNTKDSPSSEK